MKTNYVKKLSVASIAAISKNFKAEKHDTRIALMHVFGRVESTETGTSQFGPWTAFVGSFKAVKLEDGEVFRAGKCLLPSIAADAIGDAVDSANGGIVEFAIEIGLRRVVKLAANGDETGAGYEYTMRPLIEIDEAADPLAALESKVKALAAPVDDLVSQAEAAETEVATTETVETATADTKKAKK